MCNLSIDICSLGDLLRGQETAISVFIVMNRSKQFGHQQYSIISDTYSIIEFDWLIRTY